jgi:hypothetical protein
LLKDRFAERPLRLKIASLKDRFADISFGTIRLRLGSHSVLSSFSAAFFLLSAQRSFLFQRSGLSSISSGLYALP